MSQAPRHSKPRTKSLPSSEVPCPSMPAASLKASSRSSAPRSQQLMLVQTRTWCSPSRLEPEEVVEARDRLQVAGGHAHHRGRLADALGGAPAVAALDGPERRHRRRALLRVALHRPADLLRQRLAGPRPRRARGPARARRAARAASSVACERPRSPRAGCRHRRSSCSSGIGGGSGRVVDVARVDGPGPLALRDQRAHRSTPPMIGSSIPRFWIRSAIRPPTDMSRRDCRLTKRGVAEVDAGGLRGAVGEDEAAQLTARALDRVVELARRHPEALGDQLEVVDQRLHRGGELVARRQHVLAVVGDPRALGQPVERLLDDPHRLAHLLQRGRGSGRSRRRRCRPGS